MNWEHKSVDVNLSDLNVDISPAMKMIEVAGHDGWELVTIVKDLVKTGVTTVFFKRPFTSDYDPNQNVRTVPSEEDMISSKRNDLDNRMQPIPTVETCLAHALNSYYLQKSWTDGSVRYLREHISRLMHSGVPTIYDHSKSDITEIINEALTLEEHSGRSGIIICSSECIKHIRCLMTRIERVGSFARYLIQHGKSEIHADDLFPARKALYVSGDNISTFYSAAPRLKS